MMKFPNNFLWGSATSSHQVEGENCDNDWWAWENAGKAPEKSGAACQQYTRFREDFKIAHALHHNAHRFSLEWSRIEPKKGEWNEGALFHYRDVLRALKESHLEPIVTLHHFTNPMWLAEERGWENPEVVALFTRYVRKVAETLGDQVRYWITLNEPLVFVYQGYLRGLWPPGEKNFKKAIRVVRNQIFAHAQAYHVLHQVAQEKHRPQPQVGFSKHAILFSPCRSHALTDRLSTWIRDTFFHDVYLKALTQGLLFYPGIFLEMHPDLKNTLDFIGLNYYTRDFVHFDGWSLPRIFGNVCSLEHHRSEGPRNALGWEIYPEGLYQMIKRFASLHLPVLITENGICTGQDEARWSFIRAHLIQVHRALEEGHIVLGYLYWSLLDNFEWAEGFRPRFGLVEVDYTTQVRTIRPSARQFSEVCRTGELHA